MVLSTKKVESQLLGRRYRWDFRVLRSKGGLREREGAFLSFLGGKRNLQSCKVLRTARASGLHYERVAKDVVERQEIMN